MENEKRRHGRVPGRVFAILPFMIGGAFLAVFYFSSDASREDNASIWNAYSWQIMHYATAKVYVVVFVALIVHMLVVATGTLTYLREVFTHHNSDYRGSGFLAGALVSAFLTIGAQIVWAKDLLYMNKTVGYGELTGPIWNFIFESDFLTLGIFFVFLFADIMFWIGCRAASAQIRECAESKLEAEADEKKAKKFERKEAYLVDLIWLVDLPVMVGTLLLSTIGEWISHGDGLHDLTRLGEQVFRDAGVPAAAMGNVKELVWRTFVPALLLGGLVFQILYSQVVLLVINLRTPAVD